MTDGFDQLLRFELGQKNSNRAHNLWGAPMIILRCLVALFLLICGRVIKSLQVIYDRNFLLTAHLVGRRSSKDSTRILLNLTNSS